jgi:hypothetical protein
MNVIRKITWASALTLALLWTGCMEATGKNSSTTPFTPPSSNAGTSVQSSSATTYYVRPDGGSTAQCTGLVDAPYSGSGADQPCAWDHPFRALPPDGTPRIAGGDTVIIASGRYMMGYGAPGADNCESDYPWDCHVPSIPSGPGASTPTRILGAGWDTGCPNPPELWGTERAWFILNLTDSNNVQIACLEITDHSDCVEDHTGSLACQRDNPPFGAWAAVGIYAEDSANVHLRNLNIHGLAVDGIHAGRLSDWTVENVRIAGNGWAGWNGDIDGNDSNSGTLTFRHWTVEWNGCGETYPDDQPTGCWGQSAGGYGDGVGTGTTGGHWIIEDSAVRYNTSDGLDLLYAREEGSLIEIRRTVAEGNAGNQVKTSGPTIIENLLTVGNCGFFEGKSFTHNVDYCRAGGNAIALTLRTDNQATVINSTITGHGDCLLIAECQEGYACGGSASILLRNDILLGNLEFQGGGDTTCLAWSDIEPDPITIDHAIINGVKNSPVPCPPDSQCGVSPGLVNESIDAFDGHLLETSLAIDQGTADGAPANDLESHPRDDQPDIGAYEYYVWEPTAWIYLPMMLRNRAQRSLQMAGIPDFRVARGVGTGNRQQQSETRGLDAWRRACP